jgi:hypothetical protein
MPTLRKLPADSLSIDRRHFPPSRPTRDAPLCTEAIGQLFSQRVSNRDRVAYRRLPGLPSTPARTGPLDAANCARSERPCIS